MKKYIVLALLILPILGFAQPRLHYFPLRVGIGTTATTSQLVVDGGVKGDTLFIGASALAITDFDTVASPGEVVRWLKITAGGTAFYAKYDSATIGDITGVTAGWGLTGGASSGAATVTVDSTAVQKKGQIEVVYSITIDSTAISTAREIPFFYVSDPVTIDTVIVIGITTAAAGTYSVVPQIAHDDTMKSAVAANVLDTPDAATSKDVGARYTSFTDATLINKEWAWVKFTTVTTAPRAIMITVIGRK